MANARPLVDATLVTEFGGVEDSSAFREEAGMDYTYVPGFSEMRKKRDIALHEYAEGRIKAKDVPVLENNLRWVRCEREGKPDNRKYAAASAAGYRAVTKTDVGKQAWITKLPPGAREAADGTIQTVAGDMMLVVTDQKHAAVNAMRKRQRAEAMFDAAGRDADGLYGVGAAIKGANPEITKQTS